MALTDSGLKALLPKEKKYRVSVGDALYVLVYPNGGKYFVWKYRFPPNRSGQFRDYQIGPYGKGPGKWTLKQAKDEVIRLDQLRKAGEDPACGQGSCDDLLAWWITHPCSVGGVRPQEGPMDNSC